MHMRKHMQDQLQNLARRISRLWNALDISVEHREAFLLPSSGLGQETFEKCTTELARLEALKREQLPPLIAAAEQA